MSTMTEEGLSDVKIEVQTNVLIMSNHTQTYIYFKLLVYNNCNIFLYRPAINYLLKELK